MQLNLRRIDERIQKLQEIRRIATDPELVAMLFEFMAAGDERTEPIPEPARVTVPASKPDAMVAAGPDDAADIVNQVVNGMDAPASSIWSRRRA